MAFLFKSKKSQDRSVNSREGTSGSQGSIQSGRGPKDEKVSGHRSTPTGSLNSIDNNDAPNSPRRGPSIEQAGQSLQQQPQPQSDLPVSIFPVLFPLRLEIRPIRPRRPRQDCLILT